jgi:hypothetical protein
MNAEDHPIQMSMQSMQPPLAVATGKYILNFPIHARLNSGQRSNFSSGRQWTKLQPTQVTQPGQEKLLLDFVINLD